MIRTEGGIVKREEIAGRSTFARPLDRAVIAVATRGRVGNTGCSMKTIVTGISRRRLSDNESR